MYVDKLALKNFRNYEILEMFFSPGINILYGDNAQGKTNVLEAIYMTATTKSHRNSKDKDIIKIGCDESHIRLELKKREVGHRIDMHLRRSKPKGVAIDGIPIRRSTELFGLINIIVFSPEDMSVVKRGPGERRRFMDMEICQLSRLYYSNLLKYNKILDQRNNLLKQIAFSHKKDLEDTLDVWDKQLVDAGSDIIRERENFIKMMNEIINEIHLELTDNKEHIKLVYEKNIEIDKYEKVLKEKRKTDIKYAMTMTGPQRDDIGIYINDDDVRLYGSQGQQRTSALSLKLSEIELVRKIINDKPILLLDDVMSELDSKRRDALLGSIDDIQTIITCTGYDDFIKERLKVDKVYKISEGNIV